jgi:hypothetical protein
VPAYRYTGPYDRVYPEIQLIDGSLRVSPGEVVDLAKPPGDGMWVLATAEDFPKVRKQQQAKKQEEVS